MGLGAKGAAGGAGGGRGGCVGGTVSLRECEMLTNNSKLGRRPPAGLLWPPAGL